MPAPRPPEEIAGTVVEFIRDEDLAGRVMLMWPGEPSRLLDPDLRLQSRQTPQLLTRRPKGGVLRRKA
jgi:hypothetical protein